MIRRLDAREIQRRSVADVSVRHAQVGRLLARSRMAENIRICRDGFDRSGNAREGFDWLGAPSIPTLVRCFRKMSIRVRILRENMRSARYASWVMMRRIRWFFRMFLRPCGCGR